MKCSVLARSENYVLNKARPDTPFFEENVNFLYNTDLLHRAISVYTYLYDRANKQGEC